MKHQALLTIQAKLNLAIKLIIIIFFLFGIDHFTVAFLVTWPLHGSEAEGDLALIQTFLHLLYKCT